MLVKWNGYLIEQATCDAPFGPQCMKSMETDWVLRIQNDLRAIRKKKIIISVITIICFLCLSFLGCWLYKIIIRKKE